MRCLGRLFGCVLLVMVIAVIPAVLWVFTMWNIVSNADEYTSTLDEKAYEEMSLLVLPGVAQAVSDGRTSEQRTIEARQASFFARVILNLTPEEWEGAADGLIDPVWLQDNLNTNLINLFAFADYEVDTLDVSVDFSPVAAAFDQHGDVLIDDIIAALESRSNCNAEQRDLYNEFIDQQSTLTAPTTSTFPNCNPGENILATMRTRLQEGQNAILAYLNELPDYQWDLRQEAARAEGTSLEEIDNTLAEIREAMFVMDQSLVAILFLPIMLLSLVVVVAVRSAREFFFWMGLPLVVSGVFTLFPLIPWMYGLLYNNDPGVVSGSTYQLGFRAQRWAFSAFSQPILAEVLLLLGVGLVFLVLAGLIRERQPQQPIYYVMPGATGFPAGQYVQTTATPTPQPMQVVSTTPPPQPKVKRPAPPPVPPLSQPSTPPKLKIKDKPPAPPRPKINLSDKRDTDGAAGDSKPIEVRYINPDQHSSAADRFKEQLSQPASPEDMTFIPTDTDDDDE
ncbi:MAG: hypothetical protein H6673_09640 [Anaerolineales bacterium]|nr:hypothetical protein [Anaerolineales bacterium]